MTPEGQDMADRAELERISRFRRLYRLGRVIDEAARRADAYFRLESALHYGVPSTRASASASGRPA